MWRSAGALTDPRSPTAVTRPFCTTNAPRSIGGRPSPTISRAPSNSVTVGGWPDKPAPRQPDERRGGQKRFIAGSLLQRTIKANVYGRVGL